MALTQPSRSPTLLSRFEPKAEVMVASKQTERLLVCLHLAGAISSQPELDGRKGTAADPGATGRAPRSPKKRKRDDSQVNSGGAAATSNQPSTTAVAVVPLRAVVDAKGTRALQILDSKLEAIPDELFLCLGSMEQDEEASRAAATRNSLQLSETDNSRVVRYGIVPKVAASTQVECQRPSAQKSEAELQEPSMQTANHLTCRGGGLAPSRTKFPCPASAKLEHALSTKEPCCQAAAPSPPAPVLDLTTATENLDSTAILSSSAPRASRTSVVNTCAAPSSSSTTATAATLVPLRAPISSSLRSAYRTLHGGRKQSVQAGLGSFFKSSSSASRQKRARPIAPARPPEKNPVCRSATRQLPNKANGNGIFNSVTTAGNQTSLEQRLARKKQKQEEWIRKRLVTASRPAAPPPPLSAQPLAPALLPHVSPSIPMSAKAEIIVSDPPSSATGSQGTHCAQTSQATKTKTTTVTMGPGFYFGDGDDLCELSDETLERLDAAVRKRMDATDNTTNTVPAVAGAGASTTPITID